MRIGRREIGRRQAFMEESGKPEGRKLGTARSRAAVFDDLAAKHLLRKQLGKKRLEASRELPRHGKIANDPGSR